MRAAAVRGAKRDSSRFSDQFITLPCSLLPCRIDGVTKALVPDEDASLEQYLLPFHPTAKSVARPPSPRVPERSLDDETLWTMYVLVCLDFIVCVPRCQDY